RRRSRSSRARLRGSTRPLRTRTARPSGWRRRAASRPSSPSPCGWTVTGSASRRVVLLCAAAFLAAACAGPTPAPPQALELLPSAGAYVPDDMDMALRDTARGLLASRPDAVDAAVARVEAEEGARAERGEGLSGALPYALDARHALVDDP